MYFSGLYFVLRLAGVGGARWSSVAVFLILLMVTGLVMLCVAADIGASV
jgi:hypothetical protein